MQVRIADIDDLDPIADLFDQYRMFYGQASDGAVARQFISERMLRRESIILGAQAANGQFAGFTQLYPSFSSVSAARIFILNDLFVARSYRRQGVARMLLHAAETVAREANVLRLFLSTAETNHPAQALYQSLGWVVDHEFQHWSLVLSPRV